MALAFGGGVRPELGRTDYSAIARGSEIAAQLSAQGSQMVGQGIANLGTSLGNAIKEYEQKKVLTNTEIGAIEGAIQSGLINPEEFTGEPAKLFGKLQKNGTLPLKEAALLNAYVNQRSIAKESDLKRLLTEAQIASTAASINASNADTANKEASTNASNVRVKEFEEDQKNRSAFGRALAGSRVVGGDIDYTNIESDYYAEGGNDPDLIKRFRESGEQPTALSAPEAEINRLVNLGVSLENATKIVSGVSRISTNPANGEITIVDLSNGIATPVRQPTPGEINQPGPPGKGQSLSELAVGSTGLGKSALMAVQRGYGLGLDLLGLDATIPGAAPIIEARQTIDASISALIRALSVNPRFPVSEIERIRKEINIAPKAFTDPETLRARIIGVDNALNNFINSEEASAKNMRLPLEDRRNAEIAADDMRQFKNLLGADRVIKMPKDSKFQTTPGGVQFRELEQ
jgi:hypothetical protein